MLNTKATGKASIVVGSPFLGTIPRNIDLVRGSIASSLPICRVSISVVVDDVVALVCFQHELGVGDDVDSGRHRVTEMHLDAQVALLYQMEADAIALVVGQVKTKGVTVPEVAARQSVPLVLPHLTGRGEQVHVAPGEEVVVKIRLERFGGYMLPVHAHGEEVDVVVLGVKRIFVVRTVVRIVIDAAQHQTFRQGAEEQVLVRVRSGARGNGVHLAVDGPHRILDCALPESLDVRHLRDRIQGGLLCKQGGTDDVGPVIGVSSTSHGRKSGLTAHQSYLDIDAVDQEFIL